MCRKGQCWILAVLIVTSGRATAQDDQLPSRDQRERWMALYAEEAAKYQMFRGGDENEPLTLVSSPILTYTNPVRVNDTHGAAFVWTSDGRPEVVGAIWSVNSTDDPTQRRLSHEFHSLSTVPIHSRHEPRVGQRGPVPDWTANEPGVELRPIPDAPPPVQSPSLRLTQLRQLARRFEASFPPELADGQGSFRLLAQPIHRYRSERHRIIDGAIFAYVMGTDPEFILVIEAAETDDGPQWRFAAAPLTNLPSHLDYQGTRVAEWPRAVPYVGDRPHFMYWGVSHRDREIQ